MTIENTLADILDFETAEPGEVRIGTILVKRPHRPGDLIAVAYRYADGEFRFEAFDSRYTLTRTETPARLHRIIGDCWDLTAEGWGDLVLTTIQQRNGECEISPVETGSIESALRKAITWVCNRA